MNLKFIGGILLILGMSIGAGILALPVAAAFLILAVKFNGCLQITT